jgi:crotonobetainyl-CoA:carnitine CoA-transferase CaiB-like acyl-CoA transferase
MDGPLNGVRVLDLTRVLAGPFATMLLGDLGADVIKVERPGDGDETRHLPPMRDGESHYFLSVKRNKRGIVIDLKQAAGRNLALQLARLSDVVVENFRPRVAARLGLDYESVKRVSPEVVYCSISAFGQDGPMAERSAFDIAMQAIGGGMSVTGELGGRPLRSGLPLADLGTGLFAALGMLAAVVEKQRTGRGQLVDVAMFDAMAGLLTQYAGRYFMTGESARPVSNGHPAVAPYGTYFARGDRPVSSAEEVKRQAQVRFEAAAERYLRDPIHVEGDELGRMVDLTPPCWKQRQSSWGLRVAPASAFGWATPRTSHSAMASSMSSLRGMRPTTGSAPVRPKASTGGRSTSTTSASAACVRRCSA